MEDKDDLLTPSEVAVILRCHRRSVIRYTRQGKHPLKVEKLSNRCFRFRRSDVEEFRIRARMGNTCEHTLAPDTILGGQYCTKCKAHFATV